MAVEAWWLLQGPGRGVFGGRGPQRSGQSVQDNLLRLMKKIMQKYAASDMLYQTPEGARRCVPEWFGPTSPLFPENMQRGAGCAFTVGPYTSPYRISLVVDTQQREIHCTINRRNTTNGGFTEPLRSMKSRKGKVVEQWLNEVLAPYALDKGLAAIERPQVTVNLFAFQDRASGALRAVLAVDSEHAYCVLASAVGHASDVEEIGRLLRIEAEHAQTRTCFTDERVLTLLAEASAAKDLCIVRENQVQVQGSDIPSAPIENAARNVFADKGQRVGRTMDVRAMERGGMFTMSREELA